MSERSSPDPPRPRRRRRLLRAALALPVLAVLLYLLRTPVLGPLAAGYAGRLAREAGGTLTIGRVGGSWWRDVVLEDVDWSAPDSPARALEDATVRVEYSLWGALRGEEDWLRRAELQARRLELAPADGGEAAEDAEPFRPPARLPAVRVELEELEVDLPGRPPLSVRAVDLSVGSPAAESWTLRADVASGSVACEGRYAEGRLEAVLRAVGLSLEQLERIAGEPAGERLAGSVAAEITARLDLTRPAAGAYGLSASVAELSFREWSSGTVEIEGGLSDGIVQVSALEARLGPNRLTGEGLSFPLEIDGVGELARSLAGRVDLAAGDLAPLLSGWRGDLPSTRASLSALIEAGGSAEVTGELEMPRGRADLVAGKVVLGPPGGDLLGETSLDLDLDVRFDDLSEVGQLAGREDWGGTVAGDLRVEGPLLRPVGRLAARGEGVRIEGFELDDVQIDAVADGERVRVDELRAQGPAWSGEASGSFLVEPAELEDVVARVSAADGTTWFEGQPSAEHLELSVDFAGPLDALGGAFSLEAEGIDLPAGTADELRASGTFLGSVVEVEEVELALLERTLRAAGRVTVEEGRTDLLLTTLVLSSPVGDWTMVEPASIVITGEGVRCEALALSDGTGSASASFDLEGAETRFASTLTRFDPAPILTLYTPPDWSFGRIDGGVRGVIGADGPRLDYELALPRLAPGPGQPVWTLEASGSLDPERFHLDRLQGESSALGRFEARADLPYAMDVEGWLQPGDVSLLVDAVNLDLRAWSGWLPDPRLRCTGTGSLFVDLSGSWELLRGRLRLAAEEVVPVEPAFDEPGLVPLDLRLDAELGERVSIREAELLAGNSTRVSASGTIERAAKISRIVEEPASLIDAPIRIAIELALPDVTWVARRVEALRRLQGELSGRGEIVGTLGEPRPTGEFEIRRGELRLAAAMPALRDLSADLALAENLWWIESLTGEIGGAHFRVDGTIDLGSELPKLELGLQGENLLLFRDDQTKLRANADLKVRGPLDGLKATGEVVLTEGRHTRNVDLFAGIPGLGNGGGGLESGGRGIAFEFWTEPPLANMELDVAIKSASPFSLNNNVARAELRPDLRLLGTGQVPILNGPVYVDPSTLSLPSGRLRISSGLIEFRRDSPFVPELALSAEMRVKGYDIDVQVSGPYDQPEIVLSSSPPLANDELLLLFLTGQAPAGSTASGLGAAGTVAVYLAQDALTSLFLSSDVDSDEELLDRLELTVGAEVSRTGAPTARAVFYLDEKPRGVGRTPYLTAERDEYDKINYGIGLLFRFR